MRYSDAYRRKPVATRVTSALPDDLAQPYGALNVQVPPPPQRNPALKRLLWWTLPAAVVVAAAGICLVALWGWSASTVRATQNDDWSQARVAYGQQATLTRHFPQPWLGQYNLGTVLVDSGEVEEGRQLLQQAYEAVPKAVRGEDGSIGPFSYECSIRFNLSAAIEKQGDVAAATGAQDEALDLYSAALDWVSPCQITGSGGGSGSSSSPESGTSEGEDAGHDSGRAGENQQVEAETGEATGESADRLREKITDLNGSSSSGPSAEDSPNSAGEGGTDSDQQRGDSDSGSGDRQESEAQRERRENLESKNHDQEQRQREKDESRNRIPGIGGW